MSNGNFKPGDVVLVQEVSADRYSDLPWLAVLEEKAGMEAWRGRVFSEMTPRSKSFIKNIGDPIFLNPEDKLTLHTSATKS
jgi:hypothetical protein